MSHPRRRSRLTRLAPLFAFGVASATFGVTVPLADAAPMRHAVPQAAINNRYAAEGGARGWLGTALGPQRPVSGGATQHFRGGSIYYSPATGARVIHGAIRDRYNELPQGIRDLLGVPRTDEIAGPAGVGRQTLFTGGRITWSMGTGARAVYGAIADRYNDTHVHAHLGLPVGEEHAGPSGSRQVRFQRGVIQWRSDRGSKATYGAIYERYRAVESRFGMATSDEFSGQRGSRVSRFSGGLIIWTPRTGAHDVHGSLLGDYGRRGWEGGPLGAPTSSERPINGGWAQDFENGRLSLVLGRGVAVENFLRPSVRAATTNDVRSTWRAGCPVGPAQLRVLDINHVRYDNTIGRGQLVLRADIVDTVVAALRDGANANFPLDKLRNPDAYGANDPAMMRDNNSSAFNCRAVVGNPYAMSPHAYGRAVDFNPRQNPYQDATGRWWPDNGLLWRDRTRNDVGMLKSNGPLVRGLTSRSFFWGGNWGNPDWHHFEYRGNLPRTATVAPDTQALPQEVLDYRPSVVAPAEGEFVPNGTPFRALAAAETSRSIVASCSSIPDDLPDATTGVAGSYRDPQGRLGNVLALDFAGPAEAQRWFTAYADALAACGQAGDDVRIGDLHTEADRLAAQRYQAYDGSDWGELGRLRGATVVLATLAGEDHDHQDLLEAAATL